MWIVDLLSGKCVLSWHGMYFDLMQQCICQCGVSERVIRLLSGCSIYLYINLLHCRAARGRNPFKPTNSNQQTRTSQRVDKLIPCYYLRAPRKIQANCQTMFLLENPRRSTPKDPGHLQNHVFAVERHKEHPERYNTIAKQCFCLRVLKGAPPKIRAICTSMFGR